MGQNTFSVHRNESALYLLNCIVKWYSMAAYNLSVPIGYVIQIVRTLKVRYNELFLTLKIEIWHISL